MANFYPIIASKINGFLETGKSLPKFSQNYAMVIFLSLRISSDLMKSLPKQKDFWFLPLGGSGEIGMNLNLYGHNGQWLMVDLGITFHDRLGIEVITPDPSAILPYQASIKGLVLTHAHEDHIGAIPYLWPYLRCPLYATPFTAAVIRQKISDKSWSHEVQIIEVPLENKVQIGHFSVEFITITHSIAEPNVLAISTPLGTIVHTGDWKLDPTPLIGKTTNSQRLKQIGDEGALALICDSTNVLSKGSSGSEQNVRNELTELFSHYPDCRITVACFASNIARLETVILAAEKYNRKVLLIGRSLYRMVEAAQQAGYLKNIPPFINDKEAAMLPHKNILLLTTGSQGEARSALARIANLQHPFVKMDKRDVIFFSSRVIPGNEKNIGALHNRLILLGAKVVTSHEEDIHVSGHPSQDELKQMYRWVRPQIAIPVHGEARHLQAHGQLAQEEGVPQVFIPYNGSLIQLSSPSAQIIDQIHAGKWALDGRRLIPLESIIFKDRNKLSIQGIIFITLLLNKTTDAIKNLHLSAIGICQSVEEHHMITSNLRSLIQAVPFDTFFENSSLISHIKQIVRHQINQEFGKKPIVEIHLI